MMVQSYMTHEQKALRVMMVVYDDDSSYNPAQNRRPTPSSRNDLNSNIMKLEEQVDRLSKLTKRINYFMNYQQL